MLKEISRIYIEVLNKVRDITARPAGSDDMSDKEYRELIEKTALSYQELSVEDVKKIVDLVYTKTRSKLGMIKKLVEDRSVNEIMVNGPNDVFIEGMNGLEKTGVSFGSKEELEEVIRNIAASSHREINEMNPVLDARLSNGSRVNAVFGNVAIDGPALTIRKFAKERITISEMIRTGVMDGNVAKVLELLVSSGYNIMISGGTSSGKTTLLNALTDFIPGDERVIVIEDSRELTLDNIEDLVQMECHTANSQGNGAVTMDMLIRTSLRMRPDRIIVGEVRGKEVAMMLQAMNTGHDGSITTGHGNSVFGMLRRLEAMYLMSEEIPLEAIRAQILEGIDIMIHLSRMRDGKRKIVEISELIGYDLNGYIVNPLFLLNGNMDLEATGNRLENREKLALRGVR